MERRKDLCLLSLKLAVWCALTGFIAACPVAEQSEPNANSEEPKKSEVQKVRTIGVVNTNAGSVTKRYSAKIIDGKILEFGQIDPSLLNRSSEYDIHLRLKFRYRRFFSFYWLHLGLNGVQSHHWKFFTLGPLCRWLNSGRSRWLSVNVSDLHFEDDTSIWERIEEIQNNQGRVQFWVRGRRDIVRAKLIFVSRAKKKKISERPRVVIDQVAPRSYIVSEGAIEFNFHATEENAAIQCSLNREPFHQCTSPIKYNQLKKRGYRFRLRALDEQGLPGYVTKYRFKVRPKKQNIVIKKIVPESSPTNQSNLTVHFKVRRASRYWFRYRWWRFWFRWWRPPTYCRLDEGEFKRCRSPVTYESLKEGAHRLEIRIAGRWWKEYYATYDWTVDVTAPELEWVTTPAVNSGEDEAVFEFRANEESEFSCTYDEQEIAPCSSPFSVKEVGSGEHKLSVVAKDKAGNVSSPLDFHWQVDDSVPVVQILDSNPMEELTNSTSLTLSFQANEPATFRCRLDNEAEYLCESPVSFHSLGEGDHEVQIVAEDVSGQTSEPIYYRWVVDTTGPDFSIQMTDPTTSPTNQDSAEFNFVSTEALQYQCVLDGVAVDCGDEEDDSDLSLSELGEGFHELEVVGIDAAGNKSENSIGWTVDFTPPEIELTNVIPADSVTEETSIYLAFTLSEVAEVSCELDNGGRLPCQSPYIANDLVDGEHEVVIRARDLAGNEATPMEYEWEVQTVVLVEIDDVSPSEAVTANDSISFSFSSEQTSDFVCTLDGGAEESCSSPQTYQGLGDGQHIFEVRGLNKKGERGDPAGYSWNVDTTAPIVSLGQPTPNWTPTANRSFSISFQSNELASFYCRLDTESEFDCDDQNVSFSDLADGQHTFHVYGVDQVGNVGAVETYTWEVNTAPLVISNVAVNNITTNSAVISWTTSVPATSQVLYGVGSTNQQSPISSPYVTNHSVTLTGLNAFTFYSFKAKSADRDGRVTESSTLNFRTLR